MVITFTLKHGGKTYKKRIVYPDHGCPNNLIDAVSRSLEIFIFKLQNNQVGTADNPIPIRYDVLVGESKKTPRVGEVWEIACCNSHGNALVKVTNEIQNDGCLRGVILDVAYCKQGNMWLLLEDEFFYSGLVRRIYEAEDNL